MSSDIELLAIVTLEKSARVYCQAPGCTKTVYKRIHVVRTREGVGFYGCVCYEKLVGKSTPTEPHYGDWGDRILTPEEQLQLQQNTESFLQQVYAQFVQKQEPIPDTTPRAVSPVATAKPESTFDYGEQRHFYCLQCDRQFHSRERYCTSCQSVKDVYTWSS